MIMYGLRIKGKEVLLKVSTQSNSDGEFCTDIQHILEDSTWEYPLWLVSSRETAEHVAKHSTDWYNAGYETPTWPRDWTAIGRRKAVELEVVEVEITVKE